MGPHHVKVAEDLLSLPASYNLAPTQRASVVLNSCDGLQVQRLAWASCHSGQRRRVCRAPPSMPASRRWPAAAHVQRPHGDLRPTA